MGSYEMQFGFLLISTTFAVIKGDWEEWSTKSGEYWV